jgi:hypothetical protein
MTMQRLPEGLNLRKADSQKGLYFGMEEISVPL